MKIFFIPLVLLLLGCVGKVNSNRHQMDKLKAISLKLKDGDDLVGALSEIDKIWLIKNTRQIPTDQSMRNIYVISEKDSKEFLMFSIQGDLGYSYRLDDVINSLVPSTDNTNDHKLNVLQPRWARVENGQFVKINSSPAE